ncbi:MAG TPA: helix-turn-helix transcriptional regulator [Pseudonocardia sp.]|nr:helix-turn-helix transcriptional regulator [Pseudonocardia sp.]
MDTRNGSVVRRRMLGRRLRQLREDAGLTLDAAAPALDWSTSTLSRIETGQQAPNVHAVRSMLDLYDVGGQQWEELVTLTREVRRKGWWRAYGFGDNTYVGFEAEACRVEEYTLAYVPGLLQIPEYSRALFLRAPFRRTPEEVENAVTVRMMRQRRLTSIEDPVELVAIIDELALHRPIGGRKVLREQLEHLIIAAELDTVSLHVLPAEVGALGALASSFLVLSFGELGEPDIAYAEHALGAVQLAKEADVELARLAFDQLRSEVFSPADSVALIGEVVASM